jgi:hypothetical protein
MRCQAMIAGVPYTTGDADIIFLPNVELSSPRFH